VRLALIHNDQAGSCIYTADDLVGLLQDQGHEVERFGQSSPAVKRAIAYRPDAVVVSGGDGTVATVAIALCDTATPMFILPTGTSNNIARAVGADHVVPLLIERMAGARTEYLDIGMIEGDGRQTSFVEAAGVGFVGAMLGEDGRLLPRIKRAWRSLRSGRVDRWQRAANGVARAVRAQPTRHFHVVVDGEDLSGDYVAIEVMNIAAIGPRTPLAPNAKPMDGRLDLVLVRPEDREPLADYIESSPAPRDPAPVATRRGVKVELDWPDRDAHVDDLLWPAPGKRQPRPRRVTVRVRGTTTLLLPRF